MKILALDYGTKRIGVALSDSTRTLASPHPFIPTESFGKIKATIDEIIKRENVTQIIIGMPRNMDGSYGPSAEMVKAFVEKLQPTLTIPIKLVDERLTTVQASRQLQDAGRNTKEQRHLVDSVSAAVLLQGHLDAVPIMEIPPPLDRPEP